MDLREAAKWGHLQHYVRTTQYSTIGHVYISYHFKFPNGNKAVVTKAVPKSNHGKIAYFVTKDADPTTTAAMSAWGAMHPEEGVHKLLKDIRNGCT